MDVSSLDGASARLAVELRLEDITDALQNLELQAGQSASFQALRRSLQDQLDFIGAGVCSMAPRTPSFRACSLANLLFCRTIRIRTATQRYPLIPRLSLLRAQLRLAATRKKETTLSLSLNPNPNLKLCAAPALIYIPRRIQSSSSASHTRISTAISA